MGKLKTQEQFEKETEQHEANKLELEKEKLKALLIVNGKVVEEKSIKDKEIIFETEWKKNEFKYIRVEIRTLENEFRAYINPIYHGIKVPEIKTFKELFCKIYIK